MKSWVNISDAVEITNNRIKPFKGERRYLATGDLIGDAVNESIVSVDYENKPSRADLLVEEGNIIVARMQATNKVLLIDEATEDLIVSTGFLNLQPKKDFDGSYLAHYFRSDVFQKKKDKYCSGATQKAINNGAFAKLQVPSYSLDEQKRIANILDQADALCQKRKQSLQLIDDFLRATFLDMFGDPLAKKNKFKTAPLGSMVDFIGGGTPSREIAEYWQGKNKWASSKDMKGLILKDTQERVSDKAIKASATKLVKPGTLLVVVKSKILMRYLPVLITESEVCFNQDIKGMVPNKEINPWYLLFHMRIGQDALLQIARGANTEGLTLDHLRNYKLILAPKDIQEQFFVIAKKTVTMIEIMQESQTELDNQFNALTQRYFVCKT
ncbi:MAG: restriction endonuclease subunit S [Candidatus Omnitrophota bacterium]